jgi:hypothetical protein
MGVEHSICSTTYVENPKSRTRGDEFNADLRELTIFSFGLEANVSPQAIEAGKIRQRQVTYLIFPTVPAAERTCVHGNQYFALLDRALVLALQG